MRRALHGIARFVVLASISMACAAETGAEHPTDDVEPRIPAEPRSPAPDPGPAPGNEAVAVGHDREIRGAWISSVYNGTWPSKTGLTKEASQAELVALFDGLAAANMNAVFLQVRPESDALYASSLEPWSRFLTGTQGQSPGWDPLAFAVEEAHARGIELHAWINPYRGLVSRTIAVAPSHVTKMLPDRAYPYGAQAWMDPGAPEVRAHIRDVVRDIVTRYDVDGIHFDDYFYPYPVAATPFPDDVTFDAYASGGGALVRPDWRRSNVDTLVREIGELVAKERPDVRFGISPFGIYRPGIPAGITGLDAYAELYCDPKKWMEQGWVDYVAPQLYWPTTRTNQAFGKLVTWWAGLAKDGRSVIVGHDVTKLGEPDWPLSEMSLQVKLSRDERPKGARGNVFFTAKAIANDDLGLRTELAKTFWKTPVATPPLATAKSETLAPPAVDAEGWTLKVSAPSIRARAFALHRRDKDAWTFVRLTPMKSGGASITVDTPGDYAISVIDRRGVESLATPIAIR
ncbi:MAG: family 10 glycosylhydrolase [Labilithrix sp.]|nr:family 10 glycosylhydrolase [Labilithrix sp.]